MKYKWILTVVVLAAMLVVAPVLTSCGEQENTPAETTTTASEIAPTTSETATETATETKILKIGVLAGLTGWISGFDTLNYSEAQMAAAMINERGGITVDGQKYNLELVVEDYKGTMDGVTAATSKLIYDHKVKFIVGPTAYFSSATTQLCEQEKILRVIGYCTLQPGELDETTQYAFLGSDANIEHGMAGVRYLAENYPDVKTVTLTCPDDGAIAGIEGPVKKMLEEAGMTVVGDTIGYSNEIVDYAPICAKIAARDADAVMQLNGVVAQCGNLLKGVRDLGYDGVYACAVAVSCADVLTIAGEEASTDFFSLGSDANTPDQDPLLVEFSKRLQDKYGTDRTILLQYANGVWELAQVIEKAQSLDPTVVRDVWEKMDTIETLYGTGNMGGLETYGINHVVAHALPIMTLNEGQIGYGGWVDIKIP